MKKKKVASMILCFVMVFVLSASVFATKSLAVEYYMAKTEMAYSTCDNPSILQWVGTASSGQVVYNNGSNYLQWGYKGSDFTQWRNIIWYPFPDNTSIRGWVPNLSVTSR